MTSMAVPSKEWMTVNRASIAYRNGVRSFIQFTRSKLGADKDWYICPCSKCKNRKSMQTSANLEEHLICNGIDKSYKIWYLHGETKRGRAGTSQAATSENPMVDMLNDAFPARDRLMAQKADKIQKDGNSAGPSHQTHSHATFQPLFEATPAVRTGECVLKDISGSIVAVGDVLDAAPGHKGLLNVRLRMIGLSSTLMFEGGGVLGTRGPGEVIQWPSYFVDYV